MDKGFIKLNRKIKEWEWYSDLAVYACFTRLLLEVNYEPKKWQGITIERGWTVGSIETLCDRLQMKKDQLKRCLKVLEESGCIEIEIKPNKYHILKVINYCKYQDTVSGKTANKTTNKTSNRTANKTVNNPTNNPDTTKEYINIKKERSGGVSLKAHTPPQEEGKAAAVTVSPEGEPTAPPERNNFEQQKNGSRVLAPLRGSGEQPERVWAAAQQGGGTARAAAQQESKPLTVREWRTYCEIKGENEFTAGDEWYKRGGSFTEKQKNQIRKVLKENGEQYTD